MSAGWWELIFLMFLMKLPIVYLCAVVWWAVRAEPRPGEGAARLAELQPDEPPPFRSFWRLRLRRPPRSGPHGHPVRRPARVAAPVRARKP